MSEQIKSEQTESHGEVTESGRNSPKEEGSPKEEISPNNSINNPKVEEWRDASKSPEAGSGQHSVQHSVQHSGQHSGQHNGQHSVQQSVQHSVQQSVHSGHHPPSTECTRISPSLAHPENSQKPPQKDLLCQACYLLPLTPRLCSNCGKIVCEVCRNNKKGNVNVSPSCPMCQKAETTYHCLPHLLSKSFRKLELTCKYHGSRCPERALSPEEYGEHVAGCKYKPGMCEYCNTGMSMGELTVHMESCPSAPYTCPNCLISLLRGGKDDHNCIHALTDRLSVMEDRLREVELMRGGDGMGIGVGVGEPGDPTPYTDVISQVEALKREVQGEDRLNNWWKAREEGLKKELLDTVKVSMNGSNGQSSKHHKHSSHTHHAHLSEKDKKHHSHNSANHVEAIALKKRPKMEGKQEKYNLEFTDDRYIASGDYKGLVKIWDIWSGKLLYNLVVDKVQIWKITKMTTGSFAMGTKLGDVHFWDLEHGYCKQSIPAWRKSISGLVECAPGVLATGAYVNKIKIWDVENTAFLGLLEGHTNFVSTLSYLGGGKLLSGSYDTTVKIWNVENFFCEQTLIGHTGWVNGIIGLPNHNNKVLSSSCDGSLIVWDLEKGLSETKIAAKMVQKPMIQCLRALQDGRITTVSGDNHIKIWDSRDWSCQALKGHTGIVSALDMVGLKKVVSSSDDRTIRVWDLETMACERTFKNSCWATSIIALHNRDIVLQSRQTISQLRRYIFSM